MDTNETNNQGEETKTNSSENSRFSKDIANGFISANIKTIALIVLVIIVLSRLFAPTIPPVKQQENEVKTEELIQRSEEMVKSSKLTALPSVQQDFKMATELIKSWFAKHGYETSVFRLTDVYDYYITPAQEANGLRDPKRFAVRFAFRKKGDAPWQDLSVLGWYLPNKLKQYENDVLIDISTWDGERRAKFSVARFEEEFEALLPK